MLDAGVCLSYVGVQSRARARLDSSSVPTPVAVSLIVGSVMETMTVEICLMNRTAVLLPVSIPCLLPARLWRRYPNAEFLDLGGTNYTEFGMYIGHSSALTKHVLVFRYVAPFPN